MSFSNYNMANGVSSKPNAFLGNMDYPIYSFQYKGNEGKGDIKNSHLAD